MLTDPGLNANGPRFERWLTQVWILSALSEAWGTKAKSFLVLLNKEADRAISHSAPLISLGIKQLIKPLCISSIQHKIAVSMFMFHI